MLSDERKAKNREGLGESLRRERLKAGYTQKALAQALGLEFYTMVSQMELGYISIPPSLWLPIALELRIDPYDWVLECILNIQPEVYEALFQKRGRREVSELLRLFHKGQLDELL